MPVPPPPPYPRLPLGASAQLLHSPTLFLLTGLLQPLPTQLSCASFTLRLLVRLVGPLACVFEKLGVTVSCGRLLPGSLSLQLDSLFSPPTPSSSHACSPLKNSEWSACVALPGLGTLRHCPVQEEGG